MDFGRLIEGRVLIVCGVAAGLTLAIGPGRAADPFPFDRELLLDVAPMPPVKRVPVLDVSPNGNARIDLWCKTVAGQVTFADSGIHIEPGPLPGALPQYSVAGQCTTNLVKPEDAPKSFADLLDPKWMGKMVKAHPAYSGTIMTATFQIVRERARRS